MSYFLVETSEDGSDHEKGIKHLPVDKTIVTIADWANRATLDSTGLASVGHDFISNRDPGVYFVSIKNCRDRHRLIRNLKIQIKNWNLGVAYIVVRRMGLGRAWKH